DIELTKRISVSLNIPVIASGGAGTPRHFAEIFVKGKADAALAASLFHYGELTISDIKNYLKKNNISVRE
ncbi:imidazole glycerol phosphate synthase subunit HisF, partial [Candidatus Gottesmanbacteria bacterium]|nr:imidazole glycerol phosphate synthase subunit HisF [Candidatus Gottesmanbacteria bacterium]